MNIQNDKKKPSIFRRVVTIVCCLSVMLMLALPSLAVGVHDIYPESLPPVPYEGKWMLYQKYGQLDDPYLIDMEGVSYMAMRIPPTYTSYFPMFFGYDNNTIGRPMYKLNADGNAWELNTRSYYIGDNGAKINLNCILYANFYISYGLTSTEANSAVYYILQGEDHPIPDDKIIPNDYEWFSVFRGEEYRVYYFSDPDSVYVEVIDDGYYVHFEGTCERRDYYPYIRDVASLTSGFKNTSSIVDSTFTIYTSDGEQFYPPVPPPPDPTESVTAGLGYVLNWVGQTVSQLFDGTLSGLLPLVAVPVAVTLLIVAIFFIKRIIWGG